AMIQYGINDVNQLHWEPTHSRMNLSLFVLSCVYPLRNLAKRIINNRAASCTQHIPQISVSDFVKNMTEIDLMCKE
ncbi:MAG: hypothetical protein K8R35_03065, partial [Bacteroidales bacterium]|nr:hypothetical protein [Bacteroidales bacterium]